MPIRCRPRPRSSPASGPWWFWDVDVNEGQLVESELAFWAQDRDGNVWNLGEYPEEYDAGTLIGAPSTWLAGVSGAEAGIHMAGQPVISNKWYVQRYAEAVDFFDCAHVLRTGRVHTVPAGTFQDVLTTEERSPLDPQGAYQLKRHAPGVGIVKVEPVNDPEGETLVMVERRQLGRTSPTPTTRRRRPPRRPPRSRHRRSRRPQRRRLWWSPRCSAARPPGSRRRRPAPSCAAPSGSA